VPLPLFQHDNAVTLERGKVRPHRVRTQSQTPGELADRRRRTAQFCNDTPARSGEKPPQPMIICHDTVQIVADGRR
jgi:hypothetical protein